MSTGFDIATVIERVIDRKIRRAKAGGPTRVTGTVVSVDADGTAWVDLGGGVRATPASRTSVELAPGDSVSGTIERGRMTIDGNLTDISAGARSVMAVKGSVSRLAAAWKEVVAAAGETSENAKAATEAAGKAEEAAKEATEKAQRAAADARTAEEKADEILAITEPIIGEFEQVKELAKENAELDAQVRDLMESSYSRKTELTEVSAYLKTWVRQSAASYKICAYYSAQGNITPSAKAALDAKKATLDQAEASLESAISGLNDANETAETAYANLADAKNLLNAAIADLSEARGILQQKRAALAELDEDDPGYAQAVADVEAATDDVEDAKAAYDSAFAAVNRMRSALDTATAAVDSASAAVNRAVTQYQTALDGFTAEASASIEVAADAVTTTVRATGNLGGMDYATCVTASATAAKVAAKENFTLASGTSVYVWFEHGNSATSGMTLAVNSTGAKAVTGDYGAWEAGSVAKFTYDGASWKFEGLCDLASRMTANETNIVQQSDRIDSVVQGLSESSHFTQDSSGFHFSVDQAIDGALDDAKGYADDIPRYKYLTSSYSASYSTLMGSSYAQEGASSSWTVSSTSGVRAGDLAAIRCTNSDTGEYVWVIVEVTGVKSTTSLTGTAHGMIDHAAGKTAVNYATDITGGGVMIHPNGDSTTGWSIGSALELLLSGVSHIWAGIKNGVAGMRVGLATAGNVFMSGDGYIDVRHGSDVMAHFGYGMGNSSDTATANAPYYTLGSRAKATANYSASEMYGPGDLVVYAGAEYVCTTPISTPESWIPQHWRRIIGNYSMSEGNYTVSSGGGSHAEGWGSRAISETTHAEGYYTIARGMESHAEGEHTQAIGVASHAEGISTEASGMASHAEGDSTKAEGKNSHAQGMGTVAGYDNQTVIGTYNANDPNNVLEIGVGSYDSNRTNAFAVDWNGRSHHYGDNDDLTTVGSVMAAYSPHTVTSVHYSQWGRLAMIFAAVKVGSALSAGAWTKVATMVSGKRPPFEAGGVLPGGNGDCAIVADGSVNVRPSAAVASGSTVYIRLTYLIA